MYDNAKEMAEDLALETQRANEWEAKYTELLAEYVQLLGEYGKIVRCKDCKHKCVKGKTTQYHYCEIWKSAVDETDFCSRGVKR